MKGSIFTALPPKIPELVTAESAAIFQLLFPAAPASL